MSDFTSRIEALEHRWMRAWISRNRADMKLLASRDLIILFGTETPALLDRPSWLHAAETRLRCTSYKFGNIYVRKQGTFGTFAAPVELEATIDGNSVLSKSFISSLWMRSPVRRRWQLTETIVTSQAHDPDLHSAVRSMQHWR